MVDKHQHYVVLNDGKHYELLECAEGVNPDVLIGEKYPGYMTVGTANSPQEAAALIESDRARFAFGSY